MKKRLMKKVIDVGKLLSDYLDELKEHYSAYNLSGISLRVYEPSTDLELWTYSITGQPVISDELIASICENDLESEAIWYQNDEDVFIWIQVSMISKVTNGVISFIDTIEASEVVEEEPEEPSCEDQKEEETPVMAPDIEASIAVKEYQQVLEELKKLFDNMPVFPFGSYAVWKKNQCDCNRCKRNSEK